MPLWINVRQSVSFASTWLNQSGSLYSIFPQYGSVELNVPPRAARTRLGGPGRFAPSAVTVDVVADAADVAAVTVAVAVSVAVACCRS